MQQQINQFTGIAIAIILDTKLEGTSGGGAGKTFDWSVIQNIHTPVILAGGLTSNNIADAILLDPNIVIGFDLSSGIESSPGIKNETTLKAFMQTAHL